MRVAVVHNRDTSGVINVFGPQNRERYNPRTVERVAKALEQGGHTVRVIDGNMNVVEELKDFMPRVVAGQRPGMVFNMAYGIQGVSRYTHLPAMLEMLGVPYVGSGPVAHGLALDKVIAKMMFQSNNLPTAGFWNFASADDHFDDLVFPVIVKPKMEAVSYGITIVDNWDDLRAAVADIVNEFQQHVLVEQFIAGREFAIGLLGNGNPEVLPIVEIDLEGDPNAIQTAEEKLRRPREKLCPAPLTPEQTHDLEELARRAFNALDLKDFARVDLRMDDAGNPYILEINSMASLGLTGTYVHAGNVAGYSYEGLINKMLDVAAVRYFGQDYATEDQRPARAAKPPDTSARIRTYLRGQAVTNEDALRRMVDTPTPPREVEAISGLEEWLVAQFRHLGFRAKEIPRVDVGNVLYLRNHDEEQNDILLLAHLDTATDGAAVPFRVEGNRIYGTGTSESKGGIATALAALRALRFVRQLRRVRVGFLITSDGTLDGAAGRGLVESSARESRCVIGLKAGDLDGAAVTSRAGRATYRVESAVRRGSRRALTAKAAIEHFCGRVLTLQGLDDEEHGVRAAITRMDVVAGFGRLPQHARAQLTLRYAEPAQAEELDAAVRRIANQRSTPGLRLSVSGGSRRPPFAASAASEALYARIDKAAGQLNVPIGAAHRWSSADISFVPEEIPAVDGLGPIGGGARSDGEYVLRSSLVERAALLAHLILQSAPRSRRED